MDSHICDKHNERYQDINMCYKCLEEMESEIKQLKSDLLEHNKNTNKVVAENQRLKEAVEKAIKHLKNIGSAGSEEDGTFTSSSDWKCARQIIGDLQKARGKNG